MNDRCSRTFSLTCVALLSVISGAALADGKPVPCADDPIFHQQDFAIGVWDVYDAGDLKNKVAVVQLQKTLKDCAIQETWTQADGKSENGLGLFTYSRLLQSWGYFWVADNAWTTAFTGALEAPGVMLYTTEAPLAKGGKRLRHWTLSVQPDGSIRELSTGTNDGKTWTTDYELRWRRSR